MNCPKKNDKKIFHKKLHRKLKIDLYINIKGSNIVLSGVWGLALIFRENILALILAATNKDPSENLNINNQTVKNV